MADILVSRGVVLPAPETISVENEIIWSADTGRTLTGRMIGDVIAEKKKLSIKWGVLTQAEYLLIANNLVAGFFPFTFNAGGISMQLESYRGSITEEHLGDIGGTYFYSSASVSIIQR